MSSYLALIYGYMSTRTGIWKVSPGGNSTTLMTVELVSLEVGFTRVENKILESNYPHKEEKIAS